MQFRKYTYVVPDWGQILRFELLIRLETLKKFGFGFDLVFYFSFCFFFFNNPGEPGSM